jgi:hypothetical protein
VRYAAWNFFLIFRTPRAAYPRSPCHTSGTARGELRKRAKEGDPNGGAISLDVEQTAEACTLAILVTVAVVRHDGRVGQDGF